MAAMRGRKGTMTYLEPDSLPLRDLLGEISLAEDYRGTRNLSGIVVHHGGDELPCHPGERTWTKHE